MGLGTMNGTGVMVTVPGDRRRSSIFSPSTLGRLRLLIEEPATIRQRRPPRIDAGGGACQTCVVT